MAAPTATYTKLRSGDWGIRVQGSVEAGAVLTVTKKSGEAKAETVAKVVWSGNGITLCAIGQSARPTSASNGRGRNWDPDKFNGYGAKRGGYVRTCKTGGNCSSFGSGRSCGAEDCDGF